MADISQVKLPNGDTYNLVDDGALEKTFAGDYGNGTVEWGQSPGSSFLSIQMMQSNGTDGGSINVGESYVSLYVNESNNTNGIIINSTSIAFDCHGNTISLPNNKYGTIALTSDIPKVYSSTNTGGYLTMATLPIYDGTVE